MQIQRTSLYYLRYAANFFIIAATFWVSIVIIQPFYLASSLYEIEFFFVSILFVWFFSARSLLLYDEFRSRNFSHELIGIIKAVLIQSVSMRVIDFGLDGIALNRTLVIYYTCLLLGGLTVQHYSIRVILEYPRKRGRNIRNILVVGAGEVV